MHALLRHRVVVLGGYGEFSRRVAAGVAAIPQVECVLGMPPGQKSMAFAARLNLPFVVLDPNEPVSLQRLLEGAFAVVNVRGPFATRDDLTIAMRCANRGVHYVDPADNRVYLAEFLRLTREARERDALLVSGAGTAPAVTGALVELLSKQFNRVNDIHIFITPGMQDQRERATVQSVLNYAARPVRTKSVGARRDALWWEQPQTVEFPAPVGRRRGYLCELADVELLAKQFDARLVTTRTGFVPGLLNMMLSVFAARRQHRPIERLSPANAMLVRAGVFMANTNASAAAVRVAVNGLRRGAEEEHVAYLIGRNGTGPAIAAAPILALLRKWLDHGVKQTGAIACVGLLDFDDLKPSLIDHDVVLVRE